MLVKWILHAFQLSVMVDEHMDLHNIKKVHLKLDKVEEEYLIVVRYESRRESEGTFEKQTAC